MTASSENEKQSEPEKSQIQGIQGSYESSVEARLNMKKKIGDSLSDKPAISVAFPPSVEVLMSQITDGKSPDDITDFFDDYFVFGKHWIFRDLETSKGVFKSLDPGLYACLDGDKSVDKLAKFEIEPFPPERCLPPSCVKLEGNRNIKEDSGSKIKRLFVGDCVWLFFFERMGIFKILGEILTDYATKGKYTISNDGRAAIILETMTREFKTGLSSTLRDRDSLYRRVLGWTISRELALDTTVNQAFSSLFHKFIQYALEYYKDKRLAVAIRGAAALPAPPSVATLITIKDTIGLLKKAFVPFDYGRNYSNTLAGIVWVIAAMDLIKRMRKTFGIPEENNQPYQYIPAAFDILVMKRPITTVEKNRYSVHRDCAMYAREILLDLEALSTEDSGFGEPGGDLEIWLDKIEAKIEGYRTAYRGLTEVDLGAPGTPVIEQQV